MRALVHLLKINGIYDEWQKIIKRHGLHWRQTDDDFDFFDKESITDMTTYIRHVIEILPADYGNT